MTSLQRMTGLLPGITLCGAISAVAIGLSSLEIDLWGHTLLGPLVIAILLGAMIRTFAPLHVFLERGVTWSAKRGLEIAVALLGLRISLATLEKAGPEMMLAVSFLVVCVIGASYMACRLVGLPQKVAVLIGCGNAICGNSAIAAIAPVIEADKQDVAKAVAFTAVFGVLLILFLPTLAHLCGFSDIAGGMLAGFTVYAVPQVFAAAGPLGGIAVQWAMLAKLARVLMLAPVMILCSLVMARQRPAQAVSMGRLKKLRSLVPWFIVAFVGIAMLNGLGLVPTALIVPAEDAGEALTLLSMAGLGLGVDGRAILSCGQRMALGVSASLMAMLGLAIGLVAMLTF